MTAMGPYISFIPSPLFRLYLLNGTFIGGGGRCGKFLLLLLLLLILLAYYPTLPAKIEWLWEV